MPSPIRTRHLAIERHQRYALRGEEETPSELWFVLHGYRQTAPRFLRYFEALDDGERLLVAPEGLHRHYLDEEERKVGASWMTSEDRQTDIEDYVAYLDRLADELASGMEREPGERVALGFSQGVHTLARWLSFGRTPLDRAIFWGAHLPPELDLGEHAGRWRRTRIHLVAGRRDRHFDDEAVAAAEERLSAAGAPCETVRFEGGHRLDREVLAGLCAGSFR